MTMKPTEYTYKNKATWVYNNLLDAFTNDERQDKRKETRDTRKNQRQGRRDIATTGPEGTPRMSQPQFKQDRQAVFDENVEAFEKKASRKAKAEGGELEDQMEDLMNEEEIHTMPDGTEMEGATHGEYEEQMEGLMDKETPMLPDEEMEEDYVDYVMNETLSDEDKNYLMSTLEQDDRLSEIFDQVVESATEFSGEGPVDGPGTEKSDSIPARLSDGEFVFTAKATEEIGVDTLMSMMKDAEDGAEQRQGVAYGGMVEDEGDPKATPIQTTGLLAAQGNIPNVAKPNKEIDEEMLKASPRRYYVPLSG